MSGLLSPLTAQAFTRIQYAWSGVESMTQWWHLAALIVGLVLLLGWTLAVYRRDTRALPAGARSALTVLRILTLVGLVIFFLGPERRRERLLQQPSRLVMLIDTSQSMAVSDEQDAAGKPQSRLDRLVESIAQRDWLQALQEKHDLLVYSFDRAGAPTHLVTLAKTGAEESPEPDAEAASEGPSGHRHRFHYHVAAGLIVLGALIGIGGSLVRWSRPASDPRHVSLLIAVVLLFGGMGLFARQDLMFPQWNPWEWMRTRRAVAEETPGDAARAANEQPGSQSNAVPGDETSTGQGDAPVDSSGEWVKRIAPRGAETRLGDALRWIVERERGGPIAGVVVVTDGRNNAGGDVESAVREAAAADIPVHAIGLGSPRSPMNVRVVDFEAPPRAYPRDQFTMTAYIQGYGWDGQRVGVALMGGPSLEQLTPLDEREVELGADGEVLPVVFQWAEDQVGERVFRVDVMPAEEQDTDPRDNQASAKVEITEQRNRVLLVAGGPTREYQFVRNLLYRDAQSEVHVWLQTARDGIAQEAHQILDGFPDDAATLFEYDCLIAFDVDWSQLAVHQVELIEQWVGEKAGGLIFVAGPVYMPGWAESRRVDRRFDLLRDLHPVSFYRSGLSSIRLGEFGSESAWPLQFTEAGVQAPFLWLEDDPRDSLRTWDRFPGVYTYYATRGAKPGARVYAYYSDPKEKVGEEPPVYFAGQFYGAGRVFYMASGEMWRLRALSDGAFERLYTKLIRYVSEGRLLQDSPRGILLAGQDRYQIGETITLQASLSDPQYRPLELPDVTASVLAPDGSRESLVLRQLGPPARTGTYAGQLTADQEGTYQIELPLPGGPLEVLRREVRVRIPQHEMQQPQRNDRLLSEVARQSGGTYYAGLDVALGQGDPMPLAAAIAPRDRQTYLPGTIDRDFQLRLMYWLLAWVVGALSLEWLTRRLYKLA